MSDPFTGEIRMVGFNFPPRSWAFCDGQLLAISQNTALFSLFGTTFGGDGRTSFGLPDLRGRVPIHVGTGAGLNPVSWGQRKGVETVSLTVDQIPSHTHNVQANSADADSLTPSNTMLARAKSGVSGGNDVPFYRPLDTVVNMATGAVTNTGGSQSHYNWQPSLVISFCVCLYGIYPSRN